MSRRTIQEAEGKSFTFCLRMLCAALAFSLALICFFKGFSASVWVDGLGYVVGFIAALFLAYALSVFGEVGGRVLIAAALLMLVLAVVAPRDSGFFRSPKEAQMLCYLVAAVCDAGGLFLVGLRRYDWFRA